jgi:hypothetical protein
MLRHSIAGLLGLFLMTAAVLAADKEVIGTVTKVNVKQKVISIKVDDATKEYTLSDETKFFGPRGGASDKGIEDDRLVKGALIKLIIAGNNKTVREVHLPERKDKTKK